MKTTIGESKRSGYFYQLCKEWLRANNPGVFVQLKDLSYNKYPRRNSPSRKMVDVHKELIGIK